MNESIEIADLTFEVRRSPRRHTVGLTVDRCGKLLIHSPQDIATTELDRWTRSKLLWVYQKLALKADMASKVSEPEFVSGESFRYLGRNYQLKVISSQKGALHFDGRRFYLRRDAKSEASDHFRHWYIAKGKEWLQKRVTFLSNKIAIVPSRIEVRDLGYHWGSCGKNGVLFFNWKVLQLPVRLADYIIVHELIHLIEAHHGPEFWKAMDRTLPDWAARKETLRIQASDLHWCGLMKVE